MAGRLYQIFISIYVMLRHPLLTIGAARAVRRG